MKEEDNNSFCGISMKPGKTYISKPEKQQSAFEILGAIIKRFPQKNIAKALINYIPLFKKYNLSFNKAIVVLFKNYCEEDIINICKHIKQELEG